MKDNLKYLEYSCNNPEKLDERYMNLKKNDLNKYVEYTNKIKSLLSDIRKDKFVDEKKFTILLNLITDSYGSKNEFNCFINACDSTIGTIKNNPETLKQIVELFFTYRNGKISADPVHIQSLIDKGSQRALGIIGQQKIVEIAQNFGFEYTNDLNIFLKNKNSVSYYKKELKEKIIPEIDFGSQNKDLDIILKSNDKYFFIESKHIKECGGAQDKQIKELIGLIKTKMPKNTFIVSFLDGVFSNKILNSEIFNVFDNKDKIIKNKIEQQQLEILDNLHKNKSAFWLNSAGLVEFLRDLA